MRQKTTNKAKHKMTNVRQKQNDKNKTKLQKHEINNKSQTKKQ